MARSSLLKRRGARTLFGRQRGVTLIEALAALFIGALIIAGVSTMINTSLNDSRDQQVAQYQSQIATAVGQALHLNYATLLTATTVGGPPVAWDAATMVSQKVIPASFQNSQNAFGQTVCLLLQQPAAGQLDAMLITTGGTVIPPVDLSYIAANSGPGGGLVAATDSADMVGAYGGWSAPVSQWTSGTCKGTPGHLANQLFMMGPGNQTNDFLYRDAVPGRPDLNVMNVPIGLTKTAIGSACTAPTAASVPFTADPTGHLMACLGGQWVPMPWREAIKDVGTLAGIAGQVPGETRVTTDDNLPYTWNGSKWVPAAVDNNGALNFPQVVTLGTACGMGIDGQPLTNPVQVGVTANGDMVYCASNKIWTLTTSHMVPGQSNTNCQVIMPSNSSNPSDYGNCLPPNNQNTWQAASQTTNNFNFQTVNLTSPGLVTVTAFSHMNHAKCNTTGWLAQVTQYLDILDPKDPSGNTSLAHTEAQTPNIADASAGTSETLSFALAAGSYQIRIITNWGIFTGDGTGQGGTWFSNYCPAGPSDTIINTPLAMGWDISIAY